MGSEKISWEISTARNLRNHRVRPPFMVKEELQLIEQPKNMSYKSSYFKKKTLFFHLVTFNHGVFLVKLGWGSLSSVELAEKKIIQTRSKKN